MFKKVSIKPIELEYVQFTYEFRDQVLSEVRETQNNVYHSWDTLGKPCIIIPNVNGEQVCHIGDYVIKHPNPKDWCKFMCCSSTVFKSLMNMFGKEV